MEPWRKLTRGAQWALSAGAFGSVWLIGLLWTQGEARTADLARAGASYAWPAAAVVMVITLRGAIRRAIARVAERIARIGLTRGQTTVDIDFNETTEEAHDATDLLEGLRKLMERD